MIAEMGSIMSRKRIIFSEELFLFATLVINFVTTFDWSSICFNFWARSTKRDGNQEIDSTSDWTKLNMGKLRDFLWFFGCFIVTFRKLSIGVVTPSINVLLTYFWDCDSEKSSDVNLINWLRQLNFLGPEKLSETTWSPQIKASFVVECPCVISSCNWDDSF